MKKKILVTTSTFPRWSTDNEPRFVYDLCLKLKNNFDIIVLAPHHEKSLKHEICNDIEVYRYQYFLKKYQTLTYEGGVLTRLKQKKVRFLLIPFFFIAQILFIRKILKTEKIDLIHAHWIIPQGICAVIVNKTLKKKVPIICTSHGGDLFALRSSIFTALKRWVLNNSNKITVVSSVMRDVLIEMGLAKEKISIISMGVDLKGKFILNEKKERRSKSIISVGRLVEKKGVKYLARAVANLKRRYSDINLIVVGDGPDKTLLELEAKKLNINNNIQFLGAKSQQELVTLYQSSLIAVFPFVIASDGDQEGLGLVVIEAMGSGCATIVSDLPATNDVVDDKINALFVKPEDVDDLTDKISYLIENPHITNAFSKQGRLSVLEKYDWEVIANKYINLLNNVSVD